MSPPSPSHREQLSSTPPSVAKLRPPPLQLDYLTDAQLTRLTRSNTRKNLGSTRNKLRSQLERVCRKLDNLAADVRLTKRNTLQPVPVVSPEADTNHVEESPKGKDEEPFKLDAVEEDEDCFAIEPATDRSVFDGKSSRTSNQKDGESVSRDTAGVESGGPKSVRISTSVTYLDYINAEKGEPVSVSTTTRFNHPTRREKGGRMRRTLSEGDNFPNVKVEGIEGVRMADILKLTGGVGVGDCPFAVPTVKGAYGPRETGRGKGKEEAFSPVTPGSMTTFKKAYAVPGAGRERQGEEEKG